MRRAFLIARGLWMSQAPWLQTLQACWGLMILPTEAIDQMYMFELRGMAKMVEHEKECDGTCAFCDPKHPGNAKAEKAMNDLFGDKQ